MLIQEAVKSGKKFKRPHQEEWVSLDDYSGWSNMVAAYQGNIFDDNGICQVDFYLSDLIADDWEVKDEAY